jgi:hypothetical protein
MKNEKLETISTNFMLLQDHYLGEKRLVEALYYSLVLSTMSGTFFFFGSTAVWTQGLVTLPLAPVSGTYAQGGLELTLLPLPHKC